MLKPRPVKRPWGSFTLFIENKQASIKILEIIEGECTSLQYHKDRDESWFVLDGSPLIRLGNREFSASRGEIINIPRTTKHRIKAPDGWGNVKILEVITGKYSEEDIVRLRDKYGRA